MKDVPSLQNKNYNSHNLLSFMCQVDIYMCDLIKSS